MQTQSEEISIPKFPNSAKCDKLEVLWELIGRWTLIADIEHMLHPGDIVKLGVDDLLALAAVDHCGAHLPICKVFLAEKFKILL